jgi:hypothetical protein
MERKTTMAQDFTVRPFQPEDEIQVVALWDLVFPDDPPWNKPADVIARKQMMQKGLFFVCLAGDQVLGTVVAGYDGVRGWVHKLATLRIIAGKASPKA